MPSKVQLIQVSNKLAFIHQPTASWFLFTCSNIADRSCPIVSAREFFYMWLQFEKIEKSPKFRWWIIAWHSTDIRDHHHKRPNSIQLSFTISIS